MNIGQLEKLGELKEKGVLTQEEFDKHKAVLLNNKTGDQSVENIDWKSLGISFLITLIYYSIALVGRDVLALLSVLHLCASIIAFILALLTKSEKRNPAVIIFSFALFFPFLGFWGALYRFFKITRELQNKKDIDWKNVGISFLITLLYYFISVGIIVWYGDEIKNGEMRTFSGVLVFVSVVFLFGQSIIMFFLSHSVQSGKYEDCESPFFIFIVTLVLAPLGVWEGLYQFLRIKQGKAILRRR